MSDQGPSDVNRQLADSPRSEGTSSQPALSGYSADQEDGIFAFRAKSEEPFPTKKRGWFSKEAFARRKRMRKLQQQRALAAIKKETDAQTQEILNRSLANFHILATTAADPSLEQLVAPQPQNPEQPMEIENQENQEEMYNFNPEEIPRVPAPNPIDPNYDPWWDDNRDFVQRYPIQDYPPIQNIEAYPGMDPLDPYYQNDYIREILEDPYQFQEMSPPYQENAPQIPNPVREPAPPMSAENVQELRTFGEEILENSERMRQVGERLVWKYDERNMDFWINPYP